MYLHSHRRLNFDISDKTKPSRKLGCPRFIPGFYYICERNINEDDDIELPGLIGLADF